jgi:hypothetical protein
MIDKILGREEFSNRPPVLMDIGAAGTIHPKWKSIARYSVCIAFEADTRGLGFEIRQSKDYRKLYVYNSIVMDKASGEADFNLTRFPPCSSVLPPRPDRLGAWAFAELFQVKETIRLKTVGIGTVLDETGIDKVDWFKTDSQGIDLRLFESLGDEQINRVLVAEFEPGIIDAYEGEDKLWHLLRFMEDRPFWMAGIAVKGSQRIRPELLGSIPTIFPSSVVRAAIKTSPGWGEVTYFNEYSARSAGLDKRDFLLGYVFALLENQIATAGEARFGDPIFPEMIRHASSRIARACLKVPILYAISRARTFLAS